MEFGNATLKQIFLYLILPFGFSVVLLFTAFHLKQRELEAYIHPGYRITLIVIGIIIGFMSLLLLWMTMIVRILLWFGLAYDAKNSIGGVVFGVGTLLVIIPVLFAAAKLTAYNSNLEDQALATKGKRLTVTITGSERQKGRHGYIYEYYFKLPAFRNRSFEGSVTRKHDVLRPGDTVMIYFLPANPEIYEEIN